MIFSPAIVVIIQYAVCLVQLKKIGDLGLLGALLADDRVVKAGVAVANDIVKFKEIVEKVQFKESGSLPPVNTMRECFILRNSC